MPVELAALMYLALYSCSSHMPVHLGEHLSLEGKPFQGREELCKPGDPHAAHGVTGDPPWGPRVSPASLGCAANSGFLSHGGLLNLFRSKHHQDVFQPLCDAAHRRAEDSWPCD